MGTLIDAYDDDPDFWDWVDDVNGSAAECLFAVRKLESALTAPFTRQRRHVPRDAGVHALVIPLVDKEDL